MLLWGTEYLKAIAIDIIKSNTKVDLLSLRVKPNQFLIGSLNKFILTKCNETYQIYENIRKQRTRIFDFLYSEIMDFPPW
jgi:hypothetical protein